MVDYIFTNIILPLVVGIVLIVIEKWLFYTAYERR
ncbi:type I addiction module toxin, Fst family [Streptococcus pneumoniae]|nr:type I addiction module toxin, Fst family [Streptococcus pneumoniae]